MKELVAAFEQLARALERNVDEFTHLDSKAGDGDLGLTAGKIAGGIRKALEANMGSTPIPPGSPPSIQPPNAHGT